MPRILFAVLLLLAARPDSGFSQEPSETLVDSFCGSSTAASPCCYQTQEPELLFKFGVPVWLPEIHGTTTVRGLSAPVDVTTREVLDLIDDINNIYAGRLDVNYGPWGAYADGLFVDLEVSRDVLERIDLSKRFDTAIVDFGITYDISNHIQQVSAMRNWDAKLLLGGRYILLEAEELRITGPRGNSVTRSGKKDWVDPLIGGQLRAPLTEFVNLSVRGDFGGFGIGTASDFTWNIEAVTEWQCSDCLQVHLGYRVLDIDQQQGTEAPPRDRFPNLPRLSDRFVYDVQMRGPIARVVFEF